MRARAWLSGLGFLSILAAIAILAVLGARVLDDTDEVRSSPIDAARELDEAAGATPPPQGGGGDGGGAVVPGRSAADVARCETNRQTVELAANAFEVTTGAPPADVAALVVAGFLAEPPDTHAIEIVDGSAVVEGVGTCAASG